MEKRTKTKLCQACEWEMWDEVEPAKKPLHTCGHSDTKPASPAPDVHDLVLQSKEWRELIADEFEAKFPTGEQVIEQAGDSWDFTPNFKLELARLIIVIYKYGTRDAYTQAHQAGRQEVLDYLENNGHDLGNWRGLLEQLKNN